MIMKGCGYSLISICTRFSTGGGNCIWCLGKGKESLPREWSLRLTLEAGEGDKEGTSKPTVVCPQGSRVWSPRDQLLIFTCVWKEERGKEEG